MASQIGIVKTVTGTATAMAADNISRNLQLGDILYADELVVTGSAGSISVELNDGRVLDIGRDSQLVLDNTVYGPIPTEATQAAETEVEAIQEAILAGADPTELAEATAAGAGADTGNEGADFVQVDYLAPEVTPTSGFDTTGISVAFPQAEPEELTIPELEAEPQPIIVDNDQDLIISIADTKDTISEEGGGTNIFTISLSETINSGNIVTVDVDFVTGSDTEDADLITAAQASLQAVADATVGVSFDGTTLVYTDAFVGTDLSFAVTAFDDSLPDSPETLNVTLSNATALNGTAVAADSEDVTITDIDNAITFAIVVTSENIEDDKATQQATITEENCHSGKK